MLGIGAKGSAAPAFKAVFPAPKPSTPARRATVLMDIPSMPPPSSNGFLKSSPSRDLLLFVIESTKPRPDSESRPVNSPPALPISFEIPISIIISYLYVFVNNAKGGMLIKSLAGKMIFGGMAEWSMATVLKTVRPARVSWVRIPLPPP